MDLSNTSFLSDYLTGHYIQMFESNLDSIEITGEEYEEEGFMKLPRLRLKALTRIPLEEVAEVLRGVGYMVWLLAERCG